MCRLASGDSFVSVKLYTDDELALHKAKRPIIVNVFPGSPNGKTLPAVS